VIQETIHRIFAGERLAFIAFQQTKPVLLMEHQDKDKAKQIGAGKSEFLPEPRSIQVFEDFQFLESRVNLFWQLIEWRILFYHVGNTLSAWFWDLDNSNYTKQNGVFHFVKPGTKREKNQSYQ